MYNSNTQSSDVNCKSTHSADQNGFSLIELMIAVGIVGIIAAIGYPNYLTHVNKTRRADGHLALMNASESLSQCQAQNFSYTNCALPAYLTTSDEGFYAITVIKNSSSFTLSATAQAEQLGDTLCPTITLDHKGKRSFTGNGPCW